MIKLPPVVGAFDEHRSTSGWTRADDRAKYAASMLAVAILLASSAVAHAHDVTGIAGGFKSGFAHPFYGWDHVAAMVAVGLWGALLGPPALWALPIAFPLMMSFGAALGIAGLPLPAVEVGIAASAVALGLMVAAAVRPPLPLAAVIVGVFAIFHGHAHGTELPASEDALGYTAGFVIATGLLHLSGIGMGLAARWDGGKIAVRTVGGLIAAGGCALLAGVA